MTSMSPSIRRSTSTPDRLADSTRSAKRSGPGSGRDRRRDLSVEAQQSEQRAKLVEYFTARLLDDQHRLAGAVGIPVDHVGSDA
jgi:hypothetical protein